MTKDQLRQIAADALKSGIQVQRIKMGARALTERQMYLRTDATDKEVEEAMLAGEIGADEVWVLRGEGRWTDVNNGKTPVPFGWDKVIA